MISVCVCYCVPVVSAFSVINSVHDSECKGLSTGIEHTACQNRANERSGIFQHFSGMPSVTGSISIVENIY